MGVNGHCTPAGLGKGSDVEGQYSATQVQISYQIDPYSRQGQDWIVQMRKAIAKHDYVADWYFVSDGATQMDAAELTIAAFPRMIILMMLAVFVLIGYSFGS